MAIRTALTDLLKIDHPILLAPMAGVSGSALTSAVSNAGGLGLLGGGYCDPTWIASELDGLAGSRFGVGLITWALQENPDVLDQVLASKPEVVFLSFGDIAPFSGKIKNSGALLAVQVQTLNGAIEADQAGADIIIAQGTEAGGHGGGRSTLPLVTAVVDALPDAIIVAAGGIADGRGLAAALMLGAHGVLCGTAFCASVEATNDPRAKDIMIRQSGDHTLRSSVFDLARGINWPDAWNLRTLKNSFTGRWHDDLAALQSDIEGEQSRYQKARSDGDFDTAAIIVGEAIDLVQTIEPAADIVTRMIEVATTRLATAANFLR